MRWLVFGTYDVRRHPRVGVLIEGLRAAGDEVLEVNVPLPVDTAERVALVRKPWRLPGFAVRLARCWRELRRLGRAARRATPPDAVLVGYLGHFDVRLARRLFPGTPIVLDHLVSALGTVRDRGLVGAARPGWRGALMGAIDDGALRRADLVVVDTAEHAEALPERDRGRAVVVPVGAGAAWFAAGLARPPSTSGRLRVVFVGLFTPLHGTPTVGAALAALADEEAIEVTMVGTGQDHDACRAAAAANPRVTWLDWVDGDHLPALVAAHDVCLGIFGTGVKARNVVPTKVFQGAAAGCAILTSDTAPQRRALGDGAAYVPAGDAAALAGALRELAADPLRLALLRSRAAARAARDFTAVGVVAPMRDRVRRGGRTAVGV